MEPPSSSMGISESKFTEALDEVDAKYKTEMLNKKKQIMDLTTQVEKLDDEKTTVQKKYTDLNSKLNAEIMRNSEFEMLLKTLHKDFNDSQVAAFMDLHNLEWMDDALEKEWLLKYTDFLKTTYEARITSFFESL